MFTQITTEIELLVAQIEKRIEFVDAMRSDEYNPNLFAENGGRLIGLTESLHEIQATQVKINDHIIDILKNTTDGSYAEKMGVLEDENEVLRDKIYLLEQDLKKMGVLKKKSKSKKKELNDILEESIKEMDEETINGIADKAYRDSNIDSEEG